jgi:hypothetical protein
MISDFAWVLAAYWMLLGAVPEYRRVLRLHSPRRALQVARRILRAPAKRRLRRIRATERMELT